MFKNFLIKKMFRAQGVPDEQIDMILGMMEKNPALFQSIAQEIEEKIKGGMDKNTAAIRVMKKYEEDLKKLA